MPKQQTYSSEEIRHWKALIYGNAKSDNKVDDWVSSDQDFSKSPGRDRSYRRAGSSSRRSNPSSQSTPKQRYSETEWLTGDSPCGNKRSYRSKATSSIGKPGVF